MCNEKSKQRKEVNKNKCIMHILYMEQQRMNEKKIIRKRKQLNRLLKRRKFFLNEFLRRL